MTKPLIVGAGSPLVDLLVEEDDAFVERLGSEKGGMELVDSDVIDGAVQSTSAEVSYVPGGSACNTLVGIGKLGGRARMIGRLGKDSLADIFQNGLSTAGVESGIIQSDAPTGRVLSVVTPDAQRTMFTCLGAAAEFHPDDVDGSHFEAATIVHVEGYQLFNRALVDKILTLSRQSGAKLSLDLASFQVVRACKPLLEQIIPESVDILLANEDEAKEFSGVGEEESLEQFAKLVDIAVVKLGERGALIARGDERLQVNASLVEAIDTTGAGDLWASGFLYGIAHGLDLERSARLGAAVAAEVVQVLGAAIPDERWEELRRLRDRLME